MKRGDGASAGQGVGGSESENQFFLPSPMEHRGERMERGQGREMQCFLKAELLILKYRRKFDTSIVSKLGPDSESDLPRAVLFGRPWRLYRSILLQDLHNHNVHLSLQYDSNGI